jgi:glycosyltransferase involved in cell wall biosynthesis
MLSICVTVKNRSRVKVDNKELLLFPNCVKSIVSSVDHGLKCELVVSDWRSNDWPLKEWLEDLANPIPVKITTVEGRFSRGKGRNIAADSAIGDELLFIDADMLICPDLIHNGLKVLKNRKAYFPVSYCYREIEHLSGWWRHSGYGNCMILRSIYRESGGWSEYYTWGPEDIHFYNKISSILEVVREEVHGFYHQWHPYDPSRVKRELRTERERKTKKIRQVQRVLNEMKKLEGITNPGDTYILVNEDAWNSNPIPGRRVFPFLEKNGQYWGLPADDQAAIQELNRLRTLGADYIVFAWPSLWWLEHYSEFNNYLNSRFKCVFQNKNIVVFEIKD